NSLRLKRRHLLYHGTLLYDFPLEQIGACLRSPPRQPDYRAGRPHDEFVANLPLERQTIEEALIKGFSASARNAPWPRELTAKLAAERFAAAEWNNRF